MKNLCVTGPMSPVSFTAKTKYFFAGILAGMMMLSPMIATVPLKAQEAANPNKKENVAAIADSYLPKLEKTPSLSGKIDEWNGAVSIPVRMGSFIAWQERGHKWANPNDAGLEAFCGWTADGLCIALDVVDDSVCNKKEPQDLWSQDGVEVFIDGRVGPKFMTRGYSKGSFQLFTAFNADKNIPMFAVNKAHGEVEGIKMNGRRTEAGYFLEVIVPWTAFPELKPEPGTLIGLQLGLDDYDPAKDGDTLQPMFMTIQGRSGLSGNSSERFKFKLVEKQEKSAQTPISLSAAIDCPKALIQDEVSCKLLIGSALGREAGRGEFYLSNSKGEKIFSTELALLDEKGPWADAKTAEHKWKLGNIPDGDYTLSLAVKDKNGQPLGTSTRRVTVIKGACDEARKFFAEAPTIFAKANIPQLAKTNPGKALEWLAAAAALEEAKWGISSFNTEFIKDGLSEWKARLALLQNGKVPEDAAPLHKLLNLCANFDGRVIVQYSSSTRMQGQKMAFINFVCNGIPLLDGHASEFASEDEAKKAFGNSSAYWGGLKNLMEETELDGKRMMISSKNYDMKKVERPSDLGISLCQPSRQTTLLLSPETWLELLGKPEGFVVGTNAPEELVKSFSVWAEKEGVQKLEMKEALTKSSFILIGNPAEQDIKDFDAKIKRVSSVSVQESGTNARILDGRLILGLSGNSNAAVKIAARLLLKGEPVKAADVDAIRAEICKSLPELPPSPLEIGMDLYVGDVHVHTMYSDGGLTPEGMYLKAMYTGMDFCVISDHNTLDGAIVASRNFQKAGIAFPALVGQEITTNWIHMNAYPLSKLISPELNAEDTVKAAREQGAAIQWNHPGSFDKDWFAKHGETALVGTGFDAWEHIPRKYDQWKKEGKLPILTGSTDTHAGCFPDLERTMIYAPSPSGKDLADAVRSGSTLILGAGGKHFAYGSDAMLAKLHARLKADRKILDGIMAERLAKALEKADLGKLLQESKGEGIAP